MLLVSSLEVWEAEAPWAQWGLDTMFLHAGVKGQDLNRHMTGRDEQCWILHAELGENHFIKSETIESLKKTCFFYIYI